MRLRMRLNQVQPQYLSKLYQKAEARLIVRIVRRLRESHPNLSVVRLKRHITRTLAARSASAATDGGAEVQRLRAEHAAVEAKHAAVEAAFASETEKRAKLQAKIKMAMLASVKLRAGGVRNRKGAVVAAAAAAATDEQSGTADAERASQQHREEHELSLIHI